LATHDLAAGWDGFTQRWAAGIVRSARHDRGEPLWRGEKLEGALRIWGEQGIGDEVLFARFASLAHEHTPRVPSACAARLVPLFARAFPHVEVYAFGAAPPAAAQIACGDVPGALGVAAVSGAPYLIPCADKRALLRTRYESLAGGRPIIGVA